MNPPSGDHLRCGYPRPVPASERAVAALGRLAEALPGGERREPQDRMAAAVAEAFTDRRHLLAQAGTGTGKSWAYLVPAILSGRRTVVATATKALQDQLANKDLPYLREHLDRDFEFAVLKGRSNYICHHHLQRSLQDGRFERAKDAAALQRIARFAAVSSSGDRADALELDARVAVLVRQPHIRRPAGEHADATAHLLLAVTIQVPIEADTRRVPHAARGGVRRVAEVGLRHRHVVHPAQRLHAATGPRSPSSGCTS